MTRYHWNVAPIVAVFLFAFGTSAFGQNLFGEHAAEHNDAPLTEAQKAAGERESIF